MGKLAEKALALGHPEEAERLIRSLLVQMQRDISDGRPPTSEALTKAAELAVGLVAATGQERWLNWLITVYTRLQRPWPARVVEGLYAIGRTPAGYDHVALQTYCQNLRECWIRLGPAERFQVRRIEGLARRLAVA